MGKATNPARARKQAIEDLDEDAIRQQRIEEGGGVERLYEGARQNHRASPLTRWKRSGELTEAHLCAIAWCMRRWPLLGHEARTTADSYERTSTGTGGGASGRVSLTRVEAGGDRRRVG